ncbi:MAG: response regulator transcription factor [Phycisphaerales bacterium]
MDIESFEHPAARVLVIEDEFDLLELLVLNLRRTGMSVDSATDGRAGLALAKKNPPDVVVLDVMLPGMLGTDVARALRADPVTSRASIIMLTAKAQESDELAGLEIGADDYVTKPFSMRVLVARVQALLRRNPPPPSHAAPLRLGPIEANLQSHRVSIDGSELQLTLTEYKLLLALLQAPDTVLSRNELISRVMGHGIIITPRTIDVHVAALRRKLGDSGGMIRTRRGIGYTISASPAPRAETVE